MTEFTLQFNNCHHCACRCPCTYWCQAISRHSTDFEIRHDYFQLFFGYRWFEIQWNTYKEAGEVLHVFCNLISVCPKNFHGSSDICLMSFIYLIQICEISHQTFEPSHRKCPTCLMIFVNIDLSGTVFTKSCLFSRSWKTINSSGHFIYRFFSNFFLIWHHLSKRLTILHQISWHLLLDFRMKNYAKAAYKAV